MSENKPIPFDAELRKTLRDALLDRHGVHLEFDESLAVSGELSHGHALVHVVVETADRSFRLSLEASAELEPNHLDSPFTARELVVDFVDMMLQDYFNAQRIMRLFPDWKPYDFQDKIIMMRASATRPAVDEAADAFLAAAGFDADGHPLAS